MAEEGPEDNTRRESHPQSMRMSLEMILNRVDSSGNMFRHFAREMRMRQPHEVSTYPIIWVGGIFSFKEVAAILLSLRMLFLAHGSCIGYQIPTNRYRAPPYPTALGNTLMFLRRFYEQYFTSRNAPLCTVLVLVSFFKFFKWEITISDDMLTDNGDINHLGLLAIVPEYHRYESGEVNSSIDDKAPSRPPRVGGYQNPQITYPEVLNNPKVIITEEVTCNLDILQPPRGNENIVTNYGLLPIPSEVRSTINQLSKECSRILSFQPVLSYFIKCFKYSLNTVRDNLPEEDHIRFLADLRERGGIKMIYENFLFKLIDPNGQLITTREVLPLDINPFDDFLDLFQFNQNPSHESHIDNGNL